LINFHFQMVQLGHIIEIESSPEPEPRLATPGAKSRDKGKGKETPYRLEFASSVIELTDSESDVDDDKSTTSRPVAPLHSNSHSGPGPSSQKWISIPNLKSNTPPTLPQQNGMLASGSGSRAGPSPAAASGTGVDPSEQNPTSATADDRNIPLFLPSDKEHDPPAPLPTTSHIERAQQVGVATREAPFLIEREPTMPILDTQPQTPTRPITPDLDPFPIKDMDPTSTAVAQILEIIPNVEPNHLLELIETHLPTFSVFPVNHDHDVGGEGAVEREATVDEQVQGVVGHVLHLLFENPDYPKADLRAGVKGKGKRVGEPEDEDDLGGKGKGKAKEIAPKKTKIDYTSIDRPFPGGQNYLDLALVCHSFHHSTTL
jgi:E3 ubiquitin-protein ligase RNF216